MGYFIVVMLLVYGIAKLVGLFVPSDAIVDVDPPESSSLSNDDLDPDIYYHNSQVARLQHNHPVEQFFLMGMMNSIGNDENNEDDTDDEETEEYWDYEDDEDVRDE